jgi:sRNA-binding protein
MSKRQRRAQRQASVGVIVRLAELYPKAFFPLEKRRRPLAVGTGPALMAALCAPPVESSLGGTLTTNVCSDAPLDGRAPAKGASNPCTLPALDGRAIARALQVYCGAALYLRRLKPGAARIGLDGKSAGRVTDDEAANARERLARILDRQKRRREGLARIRASRERRAQAEKQAKLATSLAGLKAAGKRRREGVAA